MPDTKYQQDTQRFDCLGLDLNRPVDSVKPQKYPILKNVRAFQAGRIEPRDGLYDTGLLPGSPVHSCRRLNDPQHNNWTRVIGSGTSVSWGQGIGGTPYTTVDSGYSGDPLALVPFRTDQSPTGFMYIGDRSRMRKVCIAGSVHPIGLAAPTAPCSAKVDRPLFKAVDQQNLSSTLGWNAGGTTLPTGLTGTNLNPALVRTSGTITAILYDQGTTGWATVALSSMSGVGKGEMLHFPSEFAIVHDVFPGELSGTPPPESTISGIIYDNATNGAGSLTLAAPLQFLQANCLLYNVTKSEYFRALAIVGGPDKTTSLRFTSIASFAAGDLIRFIPSCRVYLVNTYAAGPTVSTGCIGATFHKGTGNLFTSYVSPPVVDLTTIGTDPNPITVGPRSVADDDFMHIAIIVDHPERISLIQAQLYVNMSGAAPDVDNYYYREFRASDLTPNAQQQQPILTTSGTIIQNQQLHNPAAPNVVSQPLLPGNDQWVDLAFRMSDLLRVGSAATRTLQSVVKLQLAVTATADVVILFADWWIGGSYNPDTFNTTAIPYKYRYRARISDTGVTSNWSPAMVDQVDPERMQVIVTLNQYAPPAGSTLLASDFVLDIQRYGGELAQWRYVGTVENTATPPVFTDNYADDTVAVLPAEGQDSWQPWPIIGLPIEGLIAETCGISVVANTLAPNAPFDLNWAPGTEILINGVPYTIYRVVTPSLLETVESVPTMVSSPGLSFKWRINDPTIMAQNLPCLWGDEQLGAMFACGDPINPGRLYFSNGNNPDTTQENNWLDITSPSEPLMNGVVYNLRSYVFSSERMFQILATGDPNDPWHAQEIPNGKGLFSRWAITRTPSPIICFLSKDGINATTGGAPQALTDADLYEYFPNEGNLGVIVNTLIPPNIVAAEAPNLRLDYYDEYLYFDCRDIFDNYMTLVLAFDLGAITRGEAPGGWFFDSYAPGVTFHYGEEGAGVHGLLCGGSDSHLYQYAANVNDAGADILCVVRTMSRDQGDPRSEKLYGDIMIDADTKGVDVFCVPGFDNFLSNGPGTTINSASRAQTSIPMTTDGTWREARNVALNLGWAVTGAARPLLYIWEPRYTFSSTPISSTSPPGVASAGWSMSPSSLGLENWKHMGLVRIAHKSTSPIVLKMIADGVALPPITIPASGGILKQDIFRVPVQKFKLIQVSVNGTGGDVSLDTRDTYFDIKEWGSDGEYRGFRLLGDFSMVEG